MQENANNGWEIVPGQCRDYLRRRKRQIAINPAKERT